MKRHWIQRGNWKAGFPVIKTLESFDFLVILFLNKLSILKLAEGEYILKKECIQFVGNFSVEKANIAIKLDFKTCRQVIKVKFYNTAGLIN